MDHRQSFVPLKKWKNLDQSLCELCFLLFKTLLEFNFVENCLLRLASFGDTSVNDHPIARCRHSHGSVYKQFAFRSE